MPQDFTRLNAKTNCIITIILNILFQTDEMEKSKKLFARQQELLKLDQDSMKIVKEKVSK